MHWIVYCSIFHLVLYARLLTRYFYSCIFAATVHTRIQSTIFFIYLTCCYSMFGHFSANIILTVPLQNYFPNCPWPVCTTVYSLFYLHLPSSIIFLLYTTLYLYMFYSPIFYLHFIASDFFRFYSNKQTKKKTYRNITNHNRHDIDWITLKQNKHNRSKNTHVIIDRQIAFIVP